MYRASRTGCSLISEKTSSSYLNIFSPPRPLPCDDSVPPSPSPHTSYTRNRRVFETPSTKPEKRYWSGGDITQGLQDFLPPRTLDTRDDELSVYGESGFNEEKLQEKTVKEGEPLEYLIDPSEQKGKDRAHRTGEEDHWRENEYLGRDLTREVPELFTEELIRLRELIEREREEYEAEYQDKKSFEESKTPNNTGQNRREISPSPSPRGNRKMGDMNVGLFAEEDTDNVELFIDSIDFSFVLLERNYPRERREKAKLTYLYSFLTGNARSWWARLEEAKRDTWEHTIESLQEKYGRTRSLITANVNRERLNWEKAQAGINTLKQGEMYCEDYLRAADELHDIIGEGRHEVMLTARFMQGISDPVTKRMVHSMVDEPYSYHSAREAFLKTTKEEREREARQKMVEKETAKDGDGFAKSLLEVQNSMAHIVSGARAASSGRLLVHLY